MKRAVVIDAPYLANEIAARAWLEGLGIPTGALRVELFREAEILRTRVRLLDERGAAAFLDEIAEECDPIPVLRVDQLMTRVTLRRAGCLT